MKKRKTTCTVFQCFYSTRNPLSWRKIIVTLLGYLLTVNGWRKCHPSFQKDLHYNSKHEWKGTVGASSLTYFTSRLIINYWSRSWPIVVVKSHDPAGLYQESRLLTILNKEVCDSWTHYQIWQIELAEKYTSSTLCMLRNWDHLEFSIPGADQKDCGLWVFHKYNELSTDFVDWFWLRLNYANKWLKQAFFQFRYLKSLN